MWSRSRSALVPSSVMMDAVDRDAAFDHDLLGLAAGGDAGLREDLLETLFGHLVFLVLRYGLLTAVRPARPVRRASGGLRRRPIRRRLLPRSPVAVHRERFRPGPAARMSAKAIRRISSNSLSEGSSLRSFRPNWIRNSLVVLYRIGLPITFLRPATAISLRSSSVLSTPPPCTPRISMISGPVAGCL